MNIKNKTWNYSTIFLLGLGLSLGTAACSDDDDDDNPMAPDPGMAQVRAVHLSPDAPNVDIFLGDGASAISDLEFQESTGFLEVTADTYDLAISPFGGSADDAVITVPNVAFEEDLAYTAIAFNTLSSIQVLAIVDDLSTPTAGTIRVRAIHTAGGVGEVDIWNIPAMGDPAPLYENVGLGGVGAYLELPAGAYTLGFDVDNDASPDLVFSLPALAEGTIANVFAVNDGADVFLVAQLGDGTTVRVDADDPDPVLAELRAIHLSPNAPLVDLYLDGSEAAGDLGFPMSSGYLDVEVGTYDLDVAPANTSVGQSVLSVPGLTLEERVSYTAVAFDFLDEIQPLALVDDNSLVAAGTMRVRAIHTASGVGEVDIWNVPDVGDPAPLYPDFGFTAVGEYLELPVGSYNLGFDVDNDATPDLVFTTPELPSGTVANIFAVNDGTSVFLIAQLQDGTTARIDAN